MMFDFFCVCRRKNIFFFFFFCRSPANAFIVVKDIFLYIWEIVLASDGIMVVYGGVFILYNNGIIQFIIVYHSVESYCFFFFPFFFDIKSKGSENWINYQWRGGGLYIWTLNRIRIHREMEAENWFILLIRLSATINKYLLCDNFYKNGMFFSSSSITLLNASLSYIIS